jgi:hypothetical protein
LALSPSKQLENALKVGTYPSKQLANMDSIQFGLFPFEHAEGTVIRGRKSAVL